MENINMLSRNWILVIWAHSISNWNKCTDGPKVVVIVQMREQRKLEKEFKKINHSVSDDVCDYFGDLLNRQFCLCVPFPDLPLTPQVFLWGNNFLHSRGSSKRKEKDKKGGLSSFVVRWWVEARFVTDIMYIYVCVCNLHYFSSELCNSHCT